MGKRRYTCSEKDGRLLRQRWATKSIRFTAVGDIVLDAFETSSRYWSFVVVVLDASRASISLSVLCCRERCDPRRLWDDYLLIGPQIRPRPIKV